MQLLVDNNRIECTQWVPAPLEQVFAFFSDANNLETITPGWLKFHIKKQSTPEMTEGTKLDYALKVHGLPLGWRSEIKEWDPGKKFVDEQITGPYKKWVHQHLFEDDHHGTRIIDKVDYEIPGGRLGELILGPLIRRDLQKIFAYRQEKIATLFNGR